MPVECEKRQSESKRNKNQDAVKFKKIEQEVVERGFGNEAGRKGKIGSVSDNLGKKPQIKGTRVGLNSGHFSYEPGALSIVPPVP